MEDIVSRQIFTRVRRITAHTTEGEGKGKPQAKIYQIVSVCTNGSYIIKVTYICARTTSSRSEYARRITPHMEREEAEERNMVVPPECRVWLSGTFSDLGMCAE